MSSHSEHNWCDLDVFSIKRALLERVYETYDELSAGFPSACKVSCPACCHSECALHYPGSSDNAGTNRRPRLTERFDRKSSGGESQEAAADSHHNSLAEPLPQIERYSGSPSG